MSYSTVQIASFTATPSQITDPIAATTVQLQWQTQNATGVTISGIGQVDGSGSTTVTVGETTTFVLTAFDAALKQMASQTVVITVLPGIAASLVPNNTIIPFQGSAAPSGWVMCDGTDSRAPNLKSRFIVGVGAEALNASGVDQHTHPFTAITADMQTSSDGAHSHPVPSNWTAAKFDNDDDTKKNWALNVGSQFTTTPNTESFAAHSHPGTLQCSAGNTQQSQMSPPWFALCYIMKVSQ